MPSKRKIRIILGVSLLFLCLFAGPGFAAINQRPSVGAVTPNSGQNYPGEKVTFNTSYSDPDGWRDISSAYILINTTTSGLNCFLAYYNPQTNKLYLKTDDNTNWIGEFEPGTNNIIENSYVALDCAKTTVTPLDDKTIVVAWTITFKNTFSGTKNIYLSARDASYASAPWDLKGNWTIIDDRVAPTGTISINQGAKYTNKRQVDLTFSATDNPGGSGLAEIYLIDDDYNVIGLEPYTTSRELTLPDYDGERTVYVVFFDLARNFSLPDKTFTKIILDRTKPSQPKVSLLKKIVPVDGALQASWSSSDPQSGIVKYEYKITQDKPEDTRDYTVVDWTTADLTTEVIKSNLSLNAGKFYYFLVRAQNDAGDWSEVGVSEGIKAVPVDKTPPTGSIVINTGYKYTNSSSVTLKLLAEDEEDGSGVDKMEFSDDGKNWRELGDYQEAKEWILPSGDGEKTVYVRFYDKAKNASKEDYSATVILDTTPPIGTIAVNKGAEYTNSANVTLRYSAEDPGGSGAYYINFSNSKDSWPNPSDEYDARITTRKWILSEGNGEKTVYMRVLDRAGNWSDQNPLNIIKDTIMLDTNKTVTLTVKDTGATTLERNKLNASWSSTDDLSGIVKYEYSITQGYPLPDIRAITLASWTSTGLLMAAIHTFSSPLLPSQTYYFSVRAKDKDDRLSEIASSDGIKVILPDTTPPTGSIIINAGDTYTALTSVRLTLQADDGADGSGVELMRFSDDGGKTWLPKDGGPFSPTKEWAFTNTQDGEKIVFVQFRDKIGNWSGEPRQDAQGAIKDNIILYAKGLLEITDLKPNDGAAFYEGDEIHILQTIKDRDLLFLEYSYSIDGAVRADWSFFESEYRWKTLPKDAGKHKLKVEIRGSAGLNLKTSREAEVYIFRRSIPPPIPGQRE